MWEQDDAMARKRIADMSAALNIPENQMQQFMDNQITVESLAANIPLDVTTTNEQTLTTTAQSWAALQTPNFYMPTSYESSSLSDILSGSTPSTPLQPLPDPNQTASPKAHPETTPFRSPPFSSNSGTLMELSTVTPSRIRNSPTGIITKKLLQTPVTAEEPAPFVSPLSVFTPLNSKSRTQEEEEPSLHAITSLAPQPLRMSQLYNEFQIVVGEGSSNDETPTYQVDLEPSSKVKHSKSDVTMWPSSSKAQSNDAGCPPATSMDEVNLDEDDDDDSDLEDSASMPKTLGIDMDIIKESKKRAKKGVVSKLPRELRGLMGEANLCYARGDHKDAIKMCMEVIRLAPYAGEPFETLAMIYDEKGEAESSLQYSLLAAHLSKTDADQWMHLAELCLNQNDNAKALGCYLKAAKLSPKDHKIQIECGKLNLKMDNVVKAMYHYKLAIACMPPEEGDVAIRIVRDLSKKCHDSQHNVLGIGLLEQAFETHPSRFEDEDANLLCELYLMEKQFTSVFEILSKHSDLEVKYEEGEFPEDTKDIAQLSAPSTLPVDLLCKVAIAGIRMEKSELVHDFVKRICTHNPADVGDIQFELAETYMAMENYTEALMILDVLVASPKYALAAVWLRHAECHRAQSDMSSALASYKQCVKMAPGHVVAHLLYSKALRNVEKYKLASQTLEVAETYEIEAKEHMKLFFERYTVYKKWGEKLKMKKSKLTLAADAALFMFVNKFRTVAFREARVFLVACKKIAPKSGHYKLIRKRPVHLARDVDEMKDSYLTGDFDIFTKEEWLAFFDEVISLLISCQRYRDAVNLAEGMQWHNKWCENLPTRRKFEETAFCACLLGGNYKKAYTIISPWLRVDVKCNQLWNIFNQLIAKTGDQRHQKFCLRLLLKNPNNLALVILTGHNWMASGFYRTAVGEYMHAHKQVPTEPLYLFMLAVAFTNLTSQKFTDFKHSFVTQALAYFEKYMQIRGFMQECYYNIGRSMQQLGLSHFAIHYYEKALEISPPSPDGEQFDSSVFDLTREIGFNLSLIYRSSGNDNAANDTLLKYCVV